MSELLHDQFVEYFARNQSRVYGYVHTLLPNHSDAEEVFQQTVLVLWRKWNEFDADRDFVAWACGIAHLEVRNFLRKSSRRNEYLSDAVLESLADSRWEAQGWLEARRSALAGCVEKLTPRDRAILDASYVEVKQLRDAAPRLGVSANALYKTLRKIRRALIECVDRTLKMEVG